MITILDAGAVMNTSILPDLEGTIIIPEAVLHEIKSRQATQVLQLLESKHSLVIERIERKYLKLAEQASVEIGQNRVSKPDLEVIACAFKYREEGVLILSDDYGVRNIAHHVGFNSSGITTTGGKEARVYGYTCRGCGATYMKTPSECDICGHTDFKRFRKK